MVSVIIPVYNTEKYLKQCLDSILNQSMKELEIIVVDDGSNDNSAQLLKEYENKVMVVYQENKGQSAARNRALSLAKGEYIVFIDSDDFIGKDYIKKLYSTALKTGADMVLCDYTKVDQFGNVIKQCKANYIENEIRIPSYISCNRIIKRKLIDKCDFRYREGVICEDIPAMLKLECAANHVEVIPMSDYFYRTNPTSTTLTFKKKKINMNQLPFDEMKECIEYWKSYSKNFSFQEMEFFVCRIWTSLLFDIGRKCEKKIRYEMIDEMIDFMNCYFPKYYENKYVKIDGLKGLEKTQRWGTWFWTKSMRYHVIRIASSIFSIL